MPQANGEVGWSLPSAARISVVMPCCNARATIDETLRSIFGQDLPPHEVIVQDGGSRDGTLDILERHSRRITYASAPDRGQSDALNKAIQRATGDVIGWLNADDIYAPGAFRLVADAFARDENADFVYGDFALIDGAGGIIRRYYVSDWNWERLFSHGLYVFSGATFFRREVFERFGLFDTSFHFSMDLEYMLRIGREARGLHVPHVLASLRMHTGSKTGGVPLKFLAEARRAFAKHAGSSARLRLLYNLVIARSFAYLVTRKLWLSKRWTRIRPTKRL